MANLRNIGVYSEIHNSKANIIGTRYSNNQLSLPSKEVTNNYNNKNEIYSSKKSKKSKINNNMNSNNTSSKNKNIEDIDYFSMDSKFCLNEPTSYGKKTNKIIVEKKYIVDNIENIFSTLSEPKFKLVMQEYILYGIVLLVRIYFWIFLFMTTTRFEQNYCYSSIDQFDSCSFDQICEKYFSSINILLYNYTFNYHSHSSKDMDELIFEENRKINDYYRPFFLRYSYLLTRNRMFAKLQMDSIGDYTNFAVLMSHKERWNVFMRYFSFCHYEQYYNMMIMMLAVGGVLGSIIFGLLSDIYGRRAIIRYTLLTFTLGTIAMFIIFTVLDNCYFSTLNDFIKNNNIIGDSSFKNIISYVYAQTKMENIFNKNFIFILISIFLLNLGLWPTLTLCLSLLVENSKSDAAALENFRKYYLVFEGLPPILASLILPTFNNATLTFFILSIVDLVAFIYSCLFFEESIRYYYEYCEWKKLTYTILNIYKNDIKDFKTLNEFQLKIFQKKEDLRNFKNSTKKMTSLKNIKNINNYILQSRNTLFNNIIDTNKTLSRNIKRNIDFVIKLDDVKSNPFLLLTSLFSNSYFKKSRVLMLIILILLYVVLHLYQKELLEPPYYSIKDLYLDSECNYIINSILFIYLIMNILSTYFYYALFRIDFYKIAAIISLLFISFLSFVYHMENIKDTDPLINMNNYNFYMLNFYNRDKRTNFLLFFIFLVYFGLNGVIFYIFLIMVKISKTIYRCLFLAIYTISIIISIIISECIYFNMEDYFFFLASLSLLCLITFTFLTDFKELLFFVNDFKIDIFRANRIKKEKKD